MLNACFFLHNLHRETGIFVLFPLVDHRYAKLSEGFSSKHLQQTLLVTIFIIIPEHCW